MPSFLIVCCINFIVMGWFLVYKPILIDGRKFSEANTEKFVFIKFYPFPRNQSNGLKITVFAMFRDPGFAQDNTHLLWKRFWLKRRILPSWRISIATLLMRSIKSNILRTCSKSLNSLNVSV